MAVSTSPRNFSSSLVMSVGKRSRRSNKGTTERCESYIFSVTVPRPPMEESMLSSNTGSWSLLTVPAPISWILGVYAVVSCSSPPCSAARILGKTHHDLILTLASSPFVYVKSSKAVVDTGLVTVPEQ